MTEAPWALEEGHIEALRRAGLTEEALVQAVTIGAFFNYFTRMADGTGIEFDYESPLDRIQVDRGREPVSRPSLAAWPDIDGSAPPALPLRPATEAALARWHRYMLDREQPLSSRERRVTARVVAEALCDRGAVAAWSHAAPSSSRERALATYAEKLTVTPWRVDGEALEPLRKEGLDDRGVLDVISLVAFQNAISRIHFGVRVVASTEHE